MGRGLWGSGVGGGRLEDFGFVTIEFTWYLPIRLCKIPSSLAVNWKSIFHDPLYTLLVTTDPLSVPSGNHVIPKNPPPLPVSMTVPDSFATFADVRRAYNTCQLSLKFLKYVGGTFFLSPMNSSFAFFVSPAERQGDEKLVYKLIQLFSSTEIFSKRRKICA